MRLARRSVAAGLALAATLLTTGTATAHALPQSSVPSPGASLATAPPAVTITFGEEPDPKLSTIRVLDTSGNLVSTGPATAVPSDPRSLTVPLGPLGSGVYTVAWRTVSAVDGHLATGSFAFGVGAAVPTPSAGGAAGSGSAGGASTPTGTGGPTAAAIVARWLLYLGLVGLLGGAVFALAIAPPARILTRGLLPVAWLVAAAGTCGVIAEELVQAGVSLGDVPGTSFGVAILERALPLAIAGLGVAVVASRGPRRPWLATVAVGAALAMLADVLLSHAAAGDAAALGVAVQVVHVLAVGLWLGGLAGLLVTVGRTADERTARTARRFSWLATVGIATVAITGLIRAVAEVGSVDALLTTDFGRLVVAKTALLATLALLGAVNHFRNVPAAGRTVRGLRRFGSAELLVGGTVILLSASLVNLAPPVEVAAAAGPSASGTTASPAPSAAPLAVDGHDYGTSVRLHLDVSPGSAGFNTFDVAVNDYDTGAPVAADAVALRFTFPAKQDVGSSRLDLSPTGPGRFSATGSNLSLDGTWRITATVAMGPSSVEVPLEVTTRSSEATPPSPAPSVDVNAVPGLPTIYTVHLPAGRSVQVYLDPGREGANEVHATFFDGAGNELPVPSTQMAMGPVGGALAALAPRTLEPGHFVADTTLTPGTWSLAITASAPDGSPLGTRIDIPVTQ